MEKYSYVIPNKTEKIIELDKTESIQLYKNVLYPMTYSNDNIGEIQGENHIQKINLFDCNYKLILNNPVPFVYNKYNLFEQMQSIGILCYTQAEAETIVNLYKNIIDCTNYNKIFSYYDLKNSLYNKTYPIIIYLYEDRLTYADFIVNQGFMDEDFHNFTIIKYNDLMNMLKFEECEK